MEQTKYKEIVNEQLELARQRIKDVLTPVDSLTDNQIREIIGNYRVAIEPNFIPWMQRAYETAKTEVAKSVILENIQDEVSQDHPRMLRNFADFSGANLRVEQYAKVSRGCGIISKI